MTTGVGISEQQSRSVSLGENTSELTPEERQRVNRKLAASLDKELLKSIKAEFGLSLDLSRITALHGALKMGVRSKLQTSLGVTKSVGAGTTASAGTSLGGSGGVQGNYSLGKKLGLSEGGGTAAGGEGTPLAGVKLAAGTDPKGIPGLTAGITVLDKEVARVKVSAQRGVQATVENLFADALRGAGISKEKQERMKGEVAPQLGQAVTESFQSSFGPNPEFPHAMGHRILAIEVRMPRRGPWTANVTIDQLELEAEPPTGPFYFVIDGLEFRCTVIPGRSGRSQGGRTTLRVVGGAGGLSHDLEVRNYGGGSTTAKTIVGDILRDAGETLSAEADTAILSKRVDAWQRVEGTGRDALNLLLDKLGATWRVLRDGTIWIGVDEWPEVEPDGTVLDDDWGDGFIVVAPETPTMVPGIVVRGQRVEEVLHTLGESSRTLRTKLYSVGVESLMSQALEPVRHEAQYAKRYRCKVVSQGADGRVDVLVDDERMKGRGVANCAVRVGLPGSTVNIPPGSRCLVGWDDGDPSLPYVDGWESATKFTLIEVGREGRPVARVGDICKGFFAPGLQISGLGPDGPFTGTITVVTQFTCVVQGGSNALNVGAAIG